MLTDVSYQYADYIDSMDDELIPGEPSFTCERCLSDRDEPSTANPLICVLCAIELGLTEDDEIPF